MALKSSLTPFIMESQNGSVNLLTRRASPPRSRRHGVLNISSCHYRTFLNSLILNLRWEMIRSKTVCLSSIPQPQYFHVQDVKWYFRFRKPLIVMGPKVLLRHPAASIPFECWVLDPISPGHIVCPWVKAQAVTRVVFCCGKLYYEMDKSTG
jgi:2-oxoglutarate dehydrogenase complex dehydrogenase (E1) component-like enzyme